MVAEIEMKRDIKILLAGCSGFIGSFLTEVLVNEGYEVYGISRTNGKLNK